MVWKYSLTVRSRLPRDGEQIVSLYPKSYCCRADKSEEKYNDILNAKSDTCFIGLSHNVNDVVKHNCLVIKGGSHVTDFCKMWEKWRGQNRIEYDKNVESGFRKIKKKEKIVS